MERASERARKKGKEGKRKETILTCLQLDRPARERARANRPTRTGIDIDRNSEREAGERESERKRAFHPFNQNEF